MTRSVVYCKRGNLRMRMGKIDEAETMLRQALSEQVKLVEHHTEVERFRDDPANTWLDLGNVNSAQFASALRTEARMDVYQAIMGDV